MTLVDSVDSILMLYSYSGFPEHSWAIFEHAEPTKDQDHKSRMPQHQVEALISSRRAGGETVPHAPTEGNAPSSIHELSETHGVLTEARKPKATENDAVDAIASGTKLKSDIERNDKVTEDKVTRNLLVKRNTMSGLSIILTLMSIVVAFR